MHRAIVTILAVLAVAGTITVAATPATAQQSTPEPVDCEYPITVTDATGTTVAVEEEPESVVVLAPSAAQTMWEIDASEKVVGMPVNQYTSSLSGSAEKTNVVGSDNQLVQSQVVALEADLVLAPNVIDNDTVESLRRADQTVYRFEGAQSLSDIYAKTELTGRLVGGYERAAQRVAEMRQSVTAVDEAVAGRDRPDVYYALGGGFTAGSNTFIHELIRTAGGQNIAAQANITSYKQINPEVIAEQDPDWIVLPEGQSLASNAAINGTTAVQNDQIVRVNANYINQPGPRTVRPLRTMAEAFHPSASITADGEAPAPARCASTTSSTGTDEPVDGTPGTTATAAGTPTVTERQSGAETSGTATAEQSETPGGSGPGFTAGLALLALLAVVLAGRRP